jgi:soluble lytic murein transglycosylase-like protein
MRIAAPSLLLLALLLPGQSHGEVFVVRQQNGTLLFTDQPPPGRAAPTAASAAFGDAIAAAAARHGVDPLLVHAVIRAESAYDPKALSPRGAAGLMQLMPETAKRYGVVDRFDPAQNVEGGARYLRDLIGMFEGDLSLALAAYNAGEAAVLRYGGRIPPYAETRDYVVRVRAAYERLRAPSKREMPGASSARPLLGRNMTAR